MYKASTLHEPPFCKLSLAAVFSSQLSPRNMSTAEESTRLQDTKDSHHDHPDLANKQLNLLTQFFKLGPQTKTPNTNEPGNPKGKKGRKFSSVQFSSLPRSSHSKFGLTSVSNGLHSPNISSASYGFLLNPAMFWGARDYTCLRSPAPASKDRIPKYDSFPPRSANSTANQEYRDLENWGISSPSRIKEKCSTSPMVHAPHKLAEVVGIQNSFYYQVRIHHQTEKKPTKVLSCQRWAASFIHICCRCGGKRKMKTRYQRNNRPAQPHDCLILSP